MATQPDSTREPTPAERIRAITSKMRRTMPNACGDWAAEIDQALADMEAESAKAPQPPAWIKRKVRKDTDEYRVYLRARFPLGGGAPSPFHFDGHKWRYYVTSFDDLGEFDIIWRPAEEQVAAV